MSHFPTFSLELPGDPTERLSLSPSAWALLCRIQSLRPDTNTLLKIPAHMRSLREKAGLSLQGFVKRAASMGLECTKNKVIHWEESRPVMEKVALVAQVLNTTVVMIVVGALEWDYSPEEAVEVEKVYVAFGQRLSPHGHKDVRQLKGQNNKFDLAINAAIKAEQQRQSLS